MDSLFCYAIFENQNMSMVIEIVLGLLALSAVVVGVRGDTWRPKSRGWKKVSPTGWAAITLGLLAFLVGVGKSTLESAAAANEKQRIAELMAANRDASEKYTSIRQAMVRFFEEIEDTLPDAADKALSSAFKDVKLGGGITINLTPTLKNVGKDLRERLRQVASETLAGIDEIKLELEESTEHTFGQD